MKNYENINAIAPKFIEKKKAYLVGGGIGSLAAAAFLIHDGHMPAQNIHILEEKQVFGGSMDGEGNAKDGYLARGGRELESRMECIYDLYSFIPSLKNSNRSVLDEFRELNNAEPIKSHCRLIEKCGKKADFSTLGLSFEDMMSLNKLVLVNNDKLNGVTCEQWFKPEFFDTNFWYFWRTMFAFETWHSALEVKRYMVRFMHLIGGMNQLIGILHTQYNQYDSLILPLVTWLKSQGVIMELGVKVTDLDIIDTGMQKTIQRIYMTKNDIKDTIEITTNDLVFVTNGSMTENSTVGSNHEPAILNRNQKERGCWSLWENIAKKSPHLGHPEIFSGDIDKTKWMSFTMTITDNNILFDHLLKLTGDAPGMGGVVTIKDSSWLLSFTAPKQPHFISQPQNVQVLWAYGLFPDNVGDFIKKKMSDCTGEELFSELLYHLNLQSYIHEILGSSKTIPCMMPYITSQFMPRSRGDRPDVIPEGSTNLAFLGQFCEVPNDCVFTVEYSVRSAMMAVYGLLKIDKQVNPVYEGQYDVRVLMKAAKTMMGNKEISIDKLIGTILVNIGLKEL